MAFGEQFCVELKHKTERGKKHYRIFSMSNIVNKVYTARFYNLFMLKLILKEVYQTYDI